MKKTWRVGLLCLVLGMLVGCKSSPAKEGPVEDSPAEEIPAVETQVSQTLLEVGFETEEQPMSGRSGEEVLTLSAEEAHSGAGSLKVENRTSAWHGPSINVTSLLTQDREYEVSCWVRLISPEQTELQLSTQIGREEGASYPHLDLKAISVEDGWVQLTGTYQYTDLSSDFVSLYVESPSDETASFYLDDLVLKELATE